MALHVTAIGNLLKTAALGWVNDKAPRLGAALSYYTVFAIPPLFVIVIFIASLVFDSNTVRTQMFSQVGGLIGKKSAEAIQSAMAAQYESNKGVTASVLAVATLLVTATGLFIELQDALNSIWGVEEKAGQGIRGFIKNRLLSFAMIVGIGFLLLVSLVVSTALAAFGKYLSGSMQGMDTVWMVVNGIVSFAVITLLFGMIFKVLPDVKIAWRDVWVGAAVTSLLFTGGKFLLGWYLGKSSVVSSYGAAGSIVVILLWVYYSAQILFFGAEVAQVYANRYGIRIEPARNAQWLSSRRPQKVAPSKKVEPDRCRRLVSEIREEINHLRAVVAPEQR